MVDHDKLSERIEAACSMSKAARWVLIEPYASPTEKASGKLYNAGKGVHLVGLPTELNDDAIKALAAASMEIGGCWFVGLNYNAVPGGCQDCSRACLGDGDSISGCDWSPEPYRSGVPPREDESQATRQRRREVQLGLALRRSSMSRHRLPAAWLDYCRKLDAIDNDGFIDADLICLQCPQFDAVEDD